MHATDLPIIKETRSYIPKVYLQMIHQPIQFKIYSECVRCRDLGKRKQTNFRCSKDSCHVYLCPLCFQQYHIDNVYRLKK